MRSPAPPRRERWQTLLIAPADLLRLLRHAAAGTRLKVPLLPPDTRVHDASFDPERLGYLLILESAFFEAVEVSERDGVLSGAWDEQILRFENDETLDPLAAPPAPGEAVPWEAFLFAPEEVLALLRLLSSGTRIDTAAVPPDARAVDAFFNPERGFFVLVLESALFLPARPRQVGGVTHLALPERLLRLSPSV